MRNDIKEYDFLNFLLTFYLHQDNLIWNVLQLLILIQGAVIGGVYIVMEKDEIGLAFLLLLFGFLAKVFLALLRERYGQNKQVNRELLEEVANSFAKTLNPKWKFHVSNLKDEEVRKILNITLYGWRLLNWIFGLVFFSDFTLAIVLVSRTWIFKFICCSCWC